MKRLAVLTLLALAAAVLTSDTASAQHANLGFLPYGFYQPYGARYKNNIPNPPYFSMNPPVYYGARHSRPYGVSPFASPPVVNAGQNYESRLQVPVDQPRVPTPAPGMRSPTCNPCVTYSSVVAPPAVKRGVVRSNPFVTQADQLAQTDAAEIDQIAKVETETSAK